jgi:acyl carrier protein
MEWDIKEDIRVKLLGDEMYRAILPSDFSDEFNLVRSGALDSLGMMNLIIYIEKKFQVPIEVADLVEDNFLNLNRIANWIQKKRETLQET